jgi:hypothetical protein
VKFETNFGPPRSNRLANLCLLLGSRAVFLGQVLAQILPARGHVGVQLEGLEMQIGLHIPLQALECHLEGTQTDRTPGAGNVGHEINFEGCHGQDL